MIKQSKALHKCKQSTMPSMAKLATDMKVVGHIVIMYSTKHYENPVLSSKIQIYLHKDDKQQITDNGTPFVFKISIK
jgi:hypothetical protein